MSAVADVFLDMKDLMSIVSATGSQLTNYLNSVKLLTEASSSMGREHANYIFDCITFGDIDIPEKSSIPVVVNCFLSAIKESQDYGLGELPMVLLLFGFD